MTDGALPRCADLAVFPVGCIGHNAMHTIKRICEQTALAYRPVRSAGVASAVLLPRRLYAGAVRRRRASACARGRAGEGVDWWR